MSGKHYSLAFLLATSIFPVSNLASHVASGTTEIKGHRKVCRTTRTVSATTDSESNWRNPRYSMFVCVLKYIMIQKLRRPSLLLIDEAQRCHSDSHSGVLRSPPSVPSSSHGRLLPYVPKRYVVPRMGSTLSPSGGSSSSAAVGGGGGISRCANFTFSKHF